MTDTTNVSDGNEVRVCSFVRIECAIYVKFQRALFVTESHLVLLSERIESIANSVKNLKTKKLFLTYCIQNFLKI